MVIHEAEGEFSENVLPTRVNRGRICDGDSKSETLPFTLTLSMTTAPVVEFHAVAVGVLAGRASSKKP